MIVLDDDARKRITSTLEVDADPTDSDVELDVDGTRYPMAWAGSPVTKDGKWRQDASTAGRFCGSAATPDPGDVQLAPGQHAARAVVTLSDGQVLLGPTSFIKVR